MLVVISDLHLTDGTSGPSVSVGAFRLFSERLRESAVAASWRADGSYRPIDRLDVLLLGDGLDLIRSIRWTAHDVVRPWTNPQRAEFIDLVTKIASDILRHNDAGLECLRSLNRNKLLTVPPANGLRQPVLETEGQPVELRLHYLVGDCDWPLHLKGPKYDLLRQAIVRQMGLANRHDEPFPHDPLENDDLSDLLRRHRVCARHGDVFDPLSFAGDRDASSLADALVVELINRFGMLTEGQFSDLPTAALTALRDIDDVRPLLSVPDWIDRVLQRHCPLAHQRHQVKQAWDQLCERFLSLPFLREHGHAHPAERIDALSAALKFGSTPSARNVQAMLNRQQGGSFSEQTSLACFALDEQEFRNRRAKHVVYGHTHAVESIPLDTSCADGLVLNQTYFNSGTWRRVHRPTLGRFEFAACEALTYQAFYQGDERGGRPFETWTGTIGPHPCDMSVHRIDPGSPIHASLQQVPTSGVHASAPHFRASTPAARAVPRRRV